MDDVSSRCTSSKVDVELMLMNYLIIIDICLACDRIPIENLELESPEVIFVMALAGLGKFNSNKTF